MTPEEAAYHAAQRAYEEAPTVANFKALLMAQSDYEIARADKEQ